MSIELEGFIEMHIQGFMQSQSSLICFCGVEFLLQTFAIKCVIKNYVNVGRFRLSFELAFECIRSYELRIKVEFLKIPRINGVNSSLFTINIYIPIVCCVTFGSKTCL